MAKPKKSGLGKGLDALFLDNAQDEAEENGSFSVRISEIEPNRRQPRKDFNETALAELAECNALTAGWGLSLSPVQMRMLAECRRSALRDTGRVEFGGGVLKQLVRAFCASPYLDQENYADTLAQLQALFYHFKQESHDRIPDDELIAAMAQCFDGRAQGALDALVGLTPEELCVPDREARWEPAP